MAICNGLALVKGLEVRHLVGCIALLLSVAKAEGIKVTPARLKRAIMNSAKVMDGLICLQQGSGMIQVEKGSEYLKQYKDDSSEYVSTWTPSDTPTSSPSIQVHYLVQYPVHLNLELDLLNEILNELSAKGGDIMVEVEEELVNK